MKSLYLLRGLPGTGKTTLANLISPLLGLKIATDDYPDLYLHINGAGRKWKLGWMRRCPQ